MPRLYLIRHGKAAAGWDADSDPGLDGTGRAQAERMADALAPLGPLPIVCSPLRRTRETAAALEARWRSKAAIEPAVAEVPSPIADLAKRGAWLREVMVRRWGDLDPARQAWRQQLLQCLLALPTDTAVVTHFVAINVAVGRAIGEDDVVCFRPDNCSCTILDTGEHVLELVQRGAEAETAVG